MHGHQRAGQASQGRSKGRHPRSVTGFLLHVHVCVLFVWHNACNQLQMRVIFHYSDEVFGMLQLVGKKEGEYLCLIH